MPTGSVPDGRLPSQGSIPDVLQPGVVRASVRDGSIADGRVSGGHRAHSTGVGAWVARLPAPLSSIPPVGWMVALAVVVLGGLGAVLMGVVSASGPEGADEVTASDGTTVPANPDAELALELARAKADGVEALEVLTKKHPKDTKILIELAKAHELGKDEVAAVAAIGRALAIDTDVRKNPKAGKLLWRAAIGKKARDAAFDLLEGPMLEAGADIIYDLVITPGLEQKVLTRAEKFLASKSFQSNSSPALNVVIGLRSAKQCAQMHGLLLRAKNVGDKRALKYLRRYENRMGCGRNGARDCFPCMRADDRLSEAIRAIEKREKG